MTDALASTRENLRQLIADEKISAEATDIAALMREVLTQRDDAHAAFRLLVLRHTGEPRPALYGRPGTMEQRCRECNKPSPCPSWKLANDRLQAVR